MDLTKESERQKIPKCMEEVDNLVIKFKGSLSGEHNDGLIRGPFLDHMYSKNMMTIFKKIKQIFDPQNIYNPHKKTDARWSYSYKHMRDHF
jgi:FAD/FMN-containing dehydrogenase